MKDHGDKLAKPWDVENPDHRLGPACRCDSCDSWQTLPNELNAAGLPIGDCRWRPGIEFTTEPTYWCAHWCFIRQYREEILNRYLNKNHGIEWLLDFPTYTFESQPRYAHKQFWPYAFHLLMFLWDLHVRGAYASKRLSSLHFWSGYRVPGLRTPTFKPVNEEDQVLIERAGHLLEIETIENIFPTLCT